MNITNKKPLKIYFIGQKGIPCRQGGPERYVEQLATRLAEKGHDVYAFYRENYITHNTDEWQGVKLIKNPTISLKALDNPVGVLLASLNVLFKKADVIHYQAVGAGLWSWIPRLFKWRTKVVLTFHDEDWKHGKWGILAKIILKLGSRSAFVFCHKIIMVTKVFQDKYEKKYGDKVILILNSTNILPKIPAQEITEQWGLKGQDYILFVSRLVKHKGFHTLIEAYDKLKPDKKLVLVGDNTYTGDYVAQLKEMAKGNPNIIFTGVQTGQTLQELFSNAHTYIQPSGAESTSINLLEAMSFALPIVSSDTPENKATAAETVTYFRLGDVDDLKAKMEYALKNHEALIEVGEKAKERVKKYFEWDVNVEKVEEVYR